MGTVGSRGRRSALSMLFGSAMAVLLTVATAGAPPAPNRKVLKVPPTPRNAEAASTTGPMSS